MGVQTLTDLAVIWFVYSIYIRDELVWWTVWSAKKVQKMKHLSTAIPIHQHLSHIVWLLTCKLYMLHSSHHHHRSNDTCYTSSIITSHLHISGFCYFNSIHICDRPIIMKDIEKCTGTGAGMCGWESLYIVISLWGMYKALPEVQIWILNLSVTHLAIPMTYLPVLLPPSMYIIPASLYVSSSRGMKTSR